MIKPILLILGVVMSITCFAHADHDHADRDCDHELVLQILANENLCVEKLEDQKIYLNPERICLTDYGIYLNLNDVDFIMLTTVNSDGNGCYIYAPTPDCRSVCPYCQRRYIVRCTNPACPGKPK